MHAPWLGTARVAVVPVLDADIDVNPPDDFREQVERRIFYDPHPTTGVDRSLRRYIHTVSYGRATLDARVFPAQTAETGDDPLEVGMRSLPPGHGYTTALLVLPDGGPDRTGYAWWHDPSPINGITNFARVNLQEELGVWAMELLHIITEFADLYYTDPHLDGFDNMASAEGQHPTAHTKQAMQWLDDSAVAIKAGAGDSAYALHAIGLLQPPPPGRHAAVQIPSPFNTNHFMVEARLRVDPYEDSSYASDGIPSEGVIVYEVEGRTTVYLRTPTALSAGETFTTGPPDNDVEVSVTDSFPGGFSVRINAVETKQIKDSKDFRDTKDHRKELRDKQQWEKGPLDEKGLKDGKQWRDDFPGVVRPAAPDDLAERVSALEAIVGAVFGGAEPGHEHQAAGAPTPFIEGAERPDLSHGALYEEEDVADVRAAMHGGAAQAKRYQDTLPPR